MVVLEKSVRLGFFQAPNVDNDQEGGVWHTGQEALLENIDANPLAWIGLSKSRHITKMESSSTIDYRHNCCRVEGMANGDVLDCASFNRPILDGFVELLRGHVADQAGD